MLDSKKINSALISVFHKDGLETLVNQLKKQGATIYSTGGTAKHIKKLDAEVVEIESLTGYPSILGGRVKTLHPKVHGGILARREESQDQEELDRFEIPTIDLVVVDLYPFEATVASGASEEEVIEKIDIGGIALIRAAAKNFKDVAVISSGDQYQVVDEWMEAQEGSLTLSQRKQLAAAAFDVSSHYDTHIHTYLNGGTANGLKISERKNTALRYGENPHQSASYYGNLESEFDQLNGKPLSYNNLIDIDSAIKLVDEFTAPFFAVFKHTNPCGCAVGENLFEAWERALAGDPVSAFGGILACNGTVDEKIAASIDKLFFEVLIAKDFSPEALEILCKKKKRILLKRKSPVSPTHMVRSVLGGYLVQDLDKGRLSEQELELKTSLAPTEHEKQDVLFGDTVCKHLKSNAIAIVKNGQLIGSGIGQTSRIDAMNHAIQKAKDKGFDLKGSVLASDAFFPFSDAVELAHANEINVIVQPGGSIRDDDSIKFCENHNMCLIFTGMRHFRH